MAFAKTLILRCAFSPVPINAIFEINDCNLTNLTWMKEFEINILFFYRYQFVLPTPHTLTSMDRLLKIWWIPEKNLGCFSHCSSCLVDRYRTTEKFKQAKVHDTFIIHTWNSANVSLRKAQQWDCSSQGKYPYLNGNRILTGGADQRIIERLYFAHGVKTLQLPFLHV